MFEFLTKSRFFGRPIELYKFTYGSSLFLYTDAEFPVTFSGETYAPVPISRETTTNAGTLDRSTLEISVARDNDIAELFRTAPPTEVIGLTIYQGEADDPTGDFRALWPGRVMAAGWEGSTAKLSCEPISTSLSRIGLRRNFQYMCPHVLYGPKCKATKSPVAATISATAGRQVTLSGELANHAEFRGGLLQWTDTGGMEQRRSLTGSYLSAGTTVFGINGYCTLPAGAAVTLLRGCLHTINDCRTLHNNVDNFGGHPWIPLKNPATNISPWR